MSNQEFQCNLRCWACGKSVGITTQGPPQFGFEVAGWAKDVGWIGAVDFEYSRSLVFCSQSCLESAKTKDGRFRLRAKRLPQNGLTVAQSLALKADAASPRWDLNPPQREEYDDDTAYNVELARYADRLISAKGRNCEPNP